MGTLRTAWKMENKHRKEELYNPPFSCTLSCGLPEWQPGEALLLVDVLPKGRETALSCEIPASDPKSLGIERSQSEALWRRQFYHLQVLW